MFYLNFFNPIIFKETIINIIREKARDLIN